MINLQYSLIDLQYSLINLQYSLIDLQYSLIVLQYSLINFQYSLINFQYSLINLQYSLINLQYSLIIFQYSLINFQYSLINLQYSLTNLQYSLIILQYSLINFQYSLISLQYSLINPQYSLINLQYIPSLNAVIPTRARTWHQRLPFVRHYQDQTIHSHVVGPDMLQHVWLSAVALYSSWDRLSSIKPRSVLQHVNVEKIVQYGFVNTLVCIFCLNGVHRAASSVSCSHLPICMCQL